MTLSDYSIQTSTSNLARPISQILLSQGISNMQHLLNYMESLPYGRNSNRSDFSLVLTEKKGSCSSKHALIKQVALEQNYVDFKLMLVMYQMDEINTYGIGNAIAEAGLPYMPEAHCYIKYGNDIIDVTLAEAQEGKKVIMEEFEILPYQVVDFKVKYHRDYINNWIERNGIPLSFEEVWTIREQCILNLCA